MSDLFIPERKDLFDRACRAFEGTAQRIQEYRALAGIMQNPGNSLTQEQLTQNYESYVALRSALAVQFGVDIVQADQVFSETLQAIQATHGQTPAARSSSNWTLPSEAPGEPAPEAPQPFGQEGEYKHPKNAPWVQALEKISAVEAILEQLPERAGEFVAGVSEKLTSMREWIEKKHFVTEKMSKAIDAMEGGAMRWLEGDRGGKGRSRSSHSSQR